MGNTPITVTIPYHRNPTYLKAALDSVAQQTVLPEQLIIIDNSENGDAGMLLENFPCDVRHIRSAPNLGLAAYFNQCLDAAQTPWCTILHSDDLLLPRYVKTMSNVAQRYLDAAGIFCKTLAINQHGRHSFSFKDWGKQYLWPKRQAEIYVHEEPSMAALLRANFIMCPTVCYNLSVLKDRRFDPAWKVMLDLDLYGRLLLEGETLIGIRQTLYACRRHPAATTSINEKTFRMFEEGTRCIHNLARKSAQKGWNRAAGIGKRKLIYHLYVVFRVLRNVRPANIKDSLKFARHYATEQYKIWKTP